MSDLGNKKIMAENIRYFMELYGVTRLEVCNAIGVKYTTFTDWVKGNTYPRIDKIELMANYFHVSKSDLVEKHDSYWRGESDVSTTESGEIMITTQPSIFPFIKRHEKVIMTPLKELESIEKELSIYGTSPRLERYQTMLRSMEYQKLMDAAYGCTDEQIKIATDVLNSYKNTKSENNNEEKENKNEEKENKNEKI